MVNKMNELINMVSDDDILEYVTTLYKECVNYVEGLKVQVFINPDGKLSNIISTGCNLEGCIFICEFDTSEISDEVYEIKDSFLESEYPEISDGNYTDEMYEKANEYVNNTIDWMDFSYILDNYHERLQLQYQ